MAEPQVRLHLRGKEVVLANLALELAGAGALLFQVLLAVPRQDPMGGGQVLSEAVFCTINAWRVE